MDNPDGRPVSFTLEGLPIPTHPHTLLCRLAECKRCFGCVRAYHVGGDWCLRCMVRAMLAGGSDA